MSQTQQNTSEYLLGNIIFVLTIVILRYYCFVFFSVIAVPCDLPMSFRLYVLYNYLTKIFKSTKNLNTVTYLKICLLIVTGICMWLVENIQVPTEKIK